MFLKSANTTLKKMDDYVTYCCFIQFTRVKRMCGEFMTCIYHLHYFESKIRLNGHLRVSSYRKDKLIFTILI